MDIHLCWVCGWWLGWYMVPSAPFGLPALFFLPSRSYYSAFWIFWKGKEEKEEERKVSCLCMGGLRWELGVGKKGTVKWTVLGRAGLSSSGLCNICWYWEQQQILCHTLPGAATPGATGCERTSSPDQVTVSLGTNKMDEQYASVGRWVLRCSSLWSCVSNVQMFLSPF